MLKTGLASWPIGFPGQPLTSLSPASQCSYTLCFACLLTLLCIPEIYSDFEGNVFFSFRQSQKWWKVYHITLPFAQGRWGKEDAFLNSR